MFHSLYYIGMLLYQAMVRLAAPLNLKARAWLVGRAVSIRSLKNRKAPQENAQKTVWMHCASLGEFEQGKPVLQKLRLQFPTIKLVLTFFSPSGFEPRKNTNLADEVLYLPMDSPANARLFLNKVRPDLVVFVKYDLWYFYIREIQRLQIPLILISARFRPSQVYFHPIGRGFRKMLFACNRIFVQNSDSLHLLHQIGYAAAVLAGDNRVDSVAENARRSKENKWVASFCGDAPVLILGSTHPADEEAVLPFIENKLPKNWKVILAPHEIKPGHLQQLANRFGERAIFYSSAPSNQADMKGKMLLIIDNVGMLSSLYRYGKLAYIGGGFSAGIHNLLEPMVFGLPCIFGPKYQKFDEAHFLLENNAARSIQQGAEFEKAFLFFQDKINAKEASAQAKAYIRDNEGATEQVMDELKTFL